MVFQRKSCDDFVFEQLGGNKCKEPRFSTQTLIAQYDIVDEEEIDEINEEIYRSSPKVKPKKGFSEGYWLYEILKQPKLSLFAIKNQKRLRQNFMYEGLIS